MWATYNHTFQININNESIEFVIELFGKVLEKGKYYTTILINGMKYFAPNSNFNFNI